MTNGEMFKTASERKIAYLQYCDDCAQDDEGVLSALDWLDAEYVVKLKPCPFCGGEPEIVDLEDPDFQYYQIKCSKCACKTEARLGFHNALKIWNRRVK